MNRRGGLFAALVLAALLVVWIGRSATTPSTPAPAEATALAAPSPPRAIELPTSSAAVPLAESRESVAPVVSAAIEAPSLPPTTTPPRRDRNARDVVHLLIQDRFGAAILGAEVRLTGLRTSRSPGSHWGIADEEFVGKSDTDGAVALSFPVWVNDDLETSRLTLVVRHQEFQTRELDNFKIEPTPRVIVLERGAFLVVSGYIGDPSALVRDVTPHLTDDVDVPADSWLPIKDGRLSNSRIPAGEHGIFLAHKASDGTHYFSETLFFELASEEQKELHLALVPARTLEGFVDRAVPRPIQNGGVVYCFQATNHERKATIFVTYGAPVREDGTFRLDALPPGSGQIIGMCDGWVSKRVPGTAEDLAIQSTDPVEIEREIAELGNDAFVPQPIDFAHAGEPFELLMEPAVTLIALILDTDKKPVAGARLDLWPNVFWKCGYSQMFMNKSYAGVSDQSGRVRIENLPTGYCGYRASHERFEIPLDKQGHRSRHVDLASGEAAEIVIELSRKE